MNPEIDQLAAEVRKRAGAQLPEGRRLAKQIAADFHRDLDGVPDEHAGATLLRAAVFARNAFRANPKASALDISNALAAAGERLFHHPQTRDVAVEEADSALSAEASE
jgi:hypothetical protein